MALICCWSMNEGSGLTLNDVVGSNNATINTGASVTWQSNSGFPGTTTHWNGSGYALASSTSLTNFDGTTPFSVAVWIEPGAPSSMALLGTLETGSSFKGWELSLVHSSNVFPQFFLINTYPSNAIEIRSTTATTDGSSFPFYVVVTYDGSKTAAGALMYINGSLVGRSVLNDSLSASIATGTAVRFGARDDASLKYTGPMAFVSIYDSVLSAGQITTLYNSGVPVACTAPSSSGLLINPGMDAMARRSQMKGGMNG